MKRRFFLKGFGSFFATLASPLKVYAKENERNKSLPFNYPGYKGEHKSFKPKYIGLKKIKNFDEISTLKEIAKKAKKGEQKEDFSQIFRKLVQFINQTQGLDVQKKIEAVHRWANNEDNIKFQSDNKTGLDEFKSPIDTLINAKGDCEDFVFVKFFLLLLLGFKRDMLFFIYGNVKKYGPHMVLGVNIIDNEYILDNLENYWVISPVEHVVNFSPMFVFNSKMDSYILMSKKRKELDKHHNLHQELNLNR